MMGNITTDNIYQEHTPHLTIHGDGAYLYEPIYDDGMCCGFTKKLVMDKKTFQEMYNKWIKGSE